jgi:hypothetical protein
MALFTAGLVLHCEIPDNDSREKASSSKENDSDDFMESAIWK